MVQPLWKMVWQFFKKSTIELPYNPAITLWGIYLKEVKAGTGTDICTPKFTAALFTRAKRWKQPKSPSMDEWLNNHTMEYYSAFIIQEGNSDTRYNIDEP